MRIFFTFAILCGAAGLAWTQPPPPKKPIEVPPRFGVQHRPKVYPQATPKQALESVIAAADKGEFNYMLAHLLDPAFVERRLTERAKQFEPDVGRELIALREFQKQNPDRVVATARVPDDPVQFRAMIAEQARTRAYRQLVRDVQDKLSEDPESLKDLRRFYRSGTINEAGDTATIGLPDIRDRSVYLKKIGERWFVEDRQTDAKTTAPKK